MSLHNRNYTLILDASTSMNTADQPGGQTRWEIMQESTLSLAITCEEFAVQGLTLYLFSSHFKRYEDVKSSQIPQIFQENKPSGSTNLAIVLQDAIRRYLKQKKAGYSTVEGETILVVTDGEPDQPMTVAEVILNATQQIENHEELAISFIQVGNDTKVTRYLKSLDDQLQGIGAKYDICDTVTLDDMEDIPLTEVLRNAMFD